MFFPETVVTGAIGNRDMVHHSEAVPGQDRARRAACGENSNAGSAVSPSGTANWLAVENTSKEPARSRTSMTVSAVRRFESPCFDLLHGFGFAARPPAQRHDRE